MELKEMIKVMQHYEDGGDVEYSEDCFKTIKGESNNKNRLGLSWDWNEFGYRIKEQKQKITIEKWLVEENDIKFVVETSDADSWLKSFPTAQKLKLIESYEVEI